MKLQDTERQRMVNLEYERACSCLKQAKGNASMDFWDVVAILYAIPLFGHITHITDSFENSQIDDAMKNLL